MELPLSTSQIYKKTIISLVGRTASGKSTLAKKFARYLRTAHLEVSDVIRFSSDEVSREGLASTSSKTKEDPNWLGKLIDTAIKEKLESHDRSVIVISGLREVEALQYLKEHYNFWSFEVRSEVPIRFQRALDDRKYDTADEFLRGEIRELDLGIEEVEYEAPFAIPTDPFTDPDKLMKVAVKLLRKKGAALR